MEELPYFRFYPAEWIMGDITLCSLAARGLFADIISFYWTKDCYLTEAMLKQRFSQALSQVKELKKRGIFKVKGKEKIIEIKFLDEQYVELLTRRKRLQKAGEKGGLKSKPGFKPPLSQAEARPKHIEEKRRDIKEEIRRDPLLGEAGEKAKEILKKLNEVTECDYSDASQIIQNLQDGKGKTVEQHIHIIEVKQHDPHFRDNPQFMAPGTLFGKNFDTYRNQRIEMFKKKDDSSPPPGDPKGDWLKMINESIGEELSVFKKDDLPKIKEMFDDDAYERLIRTLKDINENGEQRSEK